MQRITEPEIMGDWQQVEAYDNADFSESHSRRVELFRDRLSGDDLCGPALDLGCGSGDITIRFARAFPRCSFIGVDGSEPMLALGAKRLLREKNLSNRVQLIKAILPSAEIPRQSYAVIMSHCLLHHLHKPSVLWRSVVSLSSPGTFVFMADLRRPPSTGEAQRIVHELASGEPEIHQHDFYNSLCAAFTPEEIEGQLEESGLQSLRVEPVGEIHVLVYGKLAGV